MQLGPPDSKIRWVSFRNDSSETVPAFGCVRITGMTQRDGLPVYTGDKPSTTFQRLYLVNGPIQVAAGKYGQATFEPQYVLVGSGTPAYAEGWGPKPSQWGIYKGYYGFTIHGDYDSDKTIVFASQYEVNAVHGVADSNISASSTGTVSVYTYEGGTTVTDTTCNITALHRFDQSTQVSSSKRVFCSWVGTGWMITQAECE